MANTLEGTTPNLPIVRCTDGVGQCTSYAWYNMRQVSNMRNVFSQYMHQPLATGRNILRLY